jgi:hypothetical protein
MLVACEDAKEVGATLTSLGWETQPLELTAGLQTERTTTGWRVSCGCRVDIAGGADLAEELGGEGYCLTLAIEPWCEVFINWGDIRGVAKGVSSAPPQATGCVI